MSCRASVSCDGVKDRLPSQLEVSSPKSRSIVLSTYYSERPVSMQHRLVSGLEQEALGTFHRAYPSGQTGSPQGAQKTERASVICV